MAKKVFISEKEDKLVSLVEKEYSQIEGISCDMDEIKPYDAKSAQRELLRKKRYGEVDRHERLPKKRTIEQLRKEFATCKYSEIEGSLHWKMRSIFYSMPTQVQTPIERLIELCTTISHIDSNYLNLNAEYDIAVKDAQRILVMAEEIKSIVDNCKQEETSLIQTILKIMDICYMRVLGDRMNSIQFDGTDLESWIRTYYYKNERLKDLIIREQYVQTIFKYSAV